MDAGIEYTVIVYHYTNIIYCLLLYYIFFSIYIHIYSIMVWFPVIHLHIHPGLM